MAPHDVLRVSTLHDPCAMLYNPRGIVSIANDAAHPPGSEDANAFGPALQPRVENDLIREWIGVTCCNWWYVVLIAIDGIHNFECGLSQSRSHSS